MKSDSKEIEISLEEYGFDHNEAKIYVFLLKKLESTAFIVAKETNIPRTTVYSTLESLKRQGFISESKRNNVSHYTAESPNRLLKLLEKKGEIINEIMPQIRAVSSRHFDAPTTKLFIGLDGIKAGLEDILETLRIQKIKQICATSQPDLLDYLPKYFPSWLKNREDLGVFTKLILPHSARGYLKSNQLREVRILPENFPFNVSVTIYANKIVFFSLQEKQPYCVIIESASITEMFKQFFLFTWKTLEQVKGDAS